MKHMVGFACWETCDMLCWLMEGVVETFPPGTHVAFHFDACKDDSLDIFDHLRNYWLHNRGYVVHRMFSETEIYPPRAEDKMMHEFMEKTDCDFIHLFQDDQRLIRPMAPDVEKLVAQVGMDRVGVIGGRDAYSNAFIDFCSSPWSMSDVAVKRPRIEPGEWKKMPYLNPGPMSYSRTLIQKIGYYDPIFESWYFWDDYCRRATLAGFENYLLGTQLHHVRFGRGRASKIAGDGQMSGRDMQRLRAKHPNL